MDGLLVSLQLGALRSCLETEIDLTYQATRIKPAEAQAPAPAAKTPSQQQQQQQQSVSIEQTCPQMQITVVPTSYASSKRKAGHLPISILTSMPAIAFPSAQQVCQPPFVSLYCLPCLLYSWE